MSAELKLFSILLCHKAYPTADVMGLLFGITQGQASDWGRQLTAEVGQFIPLHRPAHEARQLAELLAEQPTLREVIIDSTERWLPRRQDRGKQKRRYGGRKKRHGVKIVIVVTTDPVYLVSQLKYPQFHFIKAGEIANRMSPCGVRP